MCFLFSRALSLSPSLPLSLSPSLPLSLSPSLPLSLSPSPHLPLPLPLPRSRALARSLARSFPPSLPPSLYLSLSISLSSYLKGWTEAEGSPPEWDMIDMLVPVTASICLLVCLWLFIELDLLRYIRIKTNTHDSSGALPSAPSSGRPTWVIKHGNGNPLIYTWMF